MTNRPDRPEPGEHAGPQNLSAESRIDAIPDGEMPGTDPGPDQRRRALEMMPVSVRETDERPEEDRRSTLRRTGMDHDNLRPVRLTDIAAEQRLDGSAHDGEREACFDTVPDDADPLTDQG
ncbi:MAG: hypothetical protein GX573_06335 [Chloroflexi bacterium]|nr:hypothetical protein [Chloroflexota bacterium]